MKEQSAEVFTKNGKPTSFLQSKDIVDEWQPIRRQLGGIFKIKAPRCDVLLNPNKRTYIVVWRPVKIGIDSWVKIAIAVGLILLSVCALFICWKICGQLCV